MHVTGGSPQYEEITATRQASLDTIKEESSNNDDSDLLYEDIDALKAFLDKVMAQEQLQNENDLQAQLEILQEENERLQEENIELKREERRWRIEQKKIRSIINAKKKQQNLQDALLKQYRKPQQQGIHFITSPTDKNHPRAVQFGFPAQAIAGTRPVEPRPTISRRSSNEKDKQHRKKSKKGKKRKKGGKRLDFGSDDGMYK